MKKIYLSLLFLSIMSSITGLANAIDDNTQKNTKLSRLQKQYRKSIKQLKRCARGKCDRWETAKALRDLAIAATAAIATGYAAGSILIKINDPRNSNIGWRTSEKLWRISRALKKPGETVFINPAKKIYDTSKSTSRRVSEYAQQKYHERYPFNQKYPLNAIVQFQDENWKIIGFDSTKNTYTLFREEINPNSTKPTEIKAPKVEESKIG